MIAIKVPKVPEENQSLIGCKLSCKHGTCTNNGDSSYVCKCQNNWEGPNCNDEINPCQSTPCQNDGLCSKTGLSSYSCNCQNGWEGDICQIKGLYRVNNMLGVSL